MTRLYALCVLALLLYGWTVGCLYDGRSRTGRHRACYVVEGYLQGDRWGVWYYCGCKAVEYHEVYQPGEISPSAGVTIVP